ncbi:restriction endonuclease subunit S [Enterococcus lactis]|uniref:restriction endonuclease subunit S n=1 Tax=Enterococcus lactis TaxID=357441 RepID=UPI0039A4B401
MEKKKAPTLRFPEFTDDWEERKSKDIFKPKIRKGEPDLPVLSVTQTSGVVYRDEVGIDIKYDISTLKNYKVIEPNDFVISLRSFQGGFELSDKLGITSPAYTIFVPKSPEEQNNLFWRIQFKRFQFIQSLKTVTFGIRDGKSISFNEFGDLKIKFPSNILEQQKIGAFFKKLDDTIALHQRKLDLLKEQKKGFLQKMFPKNGAKIPELRFEGFSDDWEERKFENNIVSIQTGTNLLGTDANEGTPLLKMGNIQRGYFSFNKLEYLDSNSNVESENIVNYGDFLFNTRNTLELVGKGATWTGMSGKYAFNSNIARFKFNGIDTIFFNYLYNTQQVISQVHARAVGTTSVAAVYPRDLNSLLYYLPSIEEQKKIGSFFNQLDNTIALHQRKLDLLKQQKKGYLQKMFV